MPSSVPKRLLEPLNTEHWVKLREPPQIILALACFVLAAAAGLSLVLWVLKARP